jgi:calcium-dependent protein kinase
MISADIDGDNYIDYNEFVHASIDRRAIMNVEGLEKAFKLIDVDGDNKVNIKELTKVMKKGKIDINDFKEFFDQFDEDHSGDLDFEEFKAMMMKLI